MAEDTATHDYALMKSRSLKDINYDTNGTILQCYSCLAVIEIFNTSQ